MSFTGWIEFLFIALLGFVIIGPKDLPKVLYAMGRFIQSLRNLSNEFMQEFQAIQHLNEIEEEREAKKKTKPKK